MTEYYIVKFTDGTFIHLNPLSGTVPSGVSDDISHGNIIAMRYWDKNTVNQFKGFVGTKTDVKGRTWTFEFTPSTWTYKITISGSGVNTSITQNLNYWGSNTYEILALYCSADPATASSFNISVNHFGGGAAYISSDREYTLYIDGEKMYGNYGSVGSTFAESVEHVMAPVPGNHYWHGTANISTQNDFFMTEYVWHENRPDWSSSDLLGSVVLWNKGNTSSSAFNLTFHPDDVEVYTLPADPYNAGGTTGTGGGTGTFSGTGDAIGIPNLPTLSASNSGFITLFNPTLAQMHDLADYMWENSAFDLDTWKKIFADPMDAILGLSIVPVAVPDGGSAAVKVGNISTGISMNKAAAQYVEVDCGSLNIEEYWGAYLDYDPYTKAEIYLPYCGTHPLAVDDIMGKTVKVVYHVDILSGACCAYIKCGDSVLYSFIGQCASSIPITGDNWTNVINGALNIAGSVGTMVATGGASAPIAAGAIATTAINQMKPNVEKSGSMSGTGGMLAIQTPYLILTRPRQALPHKQNEFVGYPSFITEDLSTLSGYTEIESIHIENVWATKDELNEIETLLKSGVIF